MCDRHRFIKNGSFAKVIAADYSENMLQQTQQFISQDPSIRPDSYCLVRCDAARLPFATGSLDAVHAGAAIHCWPQPQVAVRKIYTQNTVAWLSVYTTASKIACQSLFDYLLLSRRPQLLNVLCLDGGDQPCAASWRRVLWHHVYGTPGPVGGGLGGRHSPTDRQGRGGACDACAIMTTRHDGFLDGFAHTHTHTTNCLVSSSMYIVNLHRPHQIGQGNM